MARGALAPVERLAQRHIASEKICDVRHRRGNRCRRLPRSRRAVLLRRHQVLHDRLDLILGGHGASLLPYSEFALDPRLPAIERALVAPAFSRYATLAQSRLQPLSPAAAAVRALLFEIAGELIHSGEWQGAEMRGGDV